MLQLPRPRPYSRAAELPVAGDVFGVVVWTVLPKVMLHWVTSRWLLERYGAWFEAHGRDQMREAVVTAAIPIR